MFGSNTDFAKALREQEALKEEKKNKARFT